MILTFCLRLRSEVLEGSLVVAGWLARIALPGCLHCNRLSLAAVSQQQKISFVHIYIARYLSCMILYACHVRRNRARRR